MIYFARQHDCEACALKPQCCPNVPARKIARSIHEAARDKARAIAKTEAYAVSRRERKKVEMLFAHLKRILRLDRLRLRGPSGAKDEFLLAATAQNLRKLAKLIPLPAPVFAACGGAAQLLVARNYRRRTSPSSRRRVLHGIRRRPALRSAQMLPFLNTAANGSNRPRHQLKKSRSSLVFSAFSRAVSV